MISNFEYQYMQALMNTYKNGAEEFNERTGEKTKHTPGVIFKVNVGKEFPMLKSKKVMWKSAIEEILWIMQKASNNINDLRPHIWDAWADENGSIGKAYGYQINKYQQVKYILDTLSKDPSSRRCVIDLWNYADKDEMNLVPCCYTSVWTIIDGKLNCMLSQRSGDAPVGVVFNTIQYSALLMMFAKHLGVECGTLTHCIADFHIYESQYEDLEKQINQYGHLLSYNEQLRETESKPFPGFTNEEMIEIYESVPVLEFKPESNDFWSFKIEDFNLVNYKSLPKIDYNVVA